MQASIESTIGQLTQQEIDDLTLAMLKYFPEDRKKPSYGMRNEDPFGFYSPRIIGTVLQSIYLAGLVERSGSGRASAYQLTPLGITVRDEKEKSNAGDDEVQSE